jgi:hypothetical protein
MRLFMKLRLSKTLPVAAAHAAISVATAYRIERDPRLPSDKRWVALLRDVPFSEFRDDTSNKEVIAAADELSRAPDFHGPKVNGRVTPQTLFRGSAFYLDANDRSGRTGRWATPAGVTVGPYISQFLYRDVPFGPQSLFARIRSYTPANEFQTGYDEWLHVQNGNAPRARNLYDSDSRYIANSRDLAAYGHAVAAFGYIGNQLLGTPAAADAAFGGLYPAAQTTQAPNNPDLKLKSNEPTQVGGKTFPGTCPESGP